MSLDHPEQKGPIQLDFSNSEYLKSINFPVQENWDAIKKELGTDGIEYVGGQDDMIQVLRQIALIEDATELKKQLTGFLDERQAFCTYAIKKVPV